MKKLWKIINDMFTRSGEPTLRMFPKRELFSNNQRKGLFLLLYQHCLPKHSVVGLSFDRYKPYRRSASQYVMTLHLGIIGIGLGFKTKEPKRDTDYETA